jgi:hypothetical protein
MPFLLRNSGPVKKLIEEIEAAVEAELKMKGVLQ